MDQQTTRIYKSLYTYMYAITSKKSRTEYHHLVNHRLMHGLFCTHNTTVYGGLWQHLWSQLKNAFEVLFSGLHFILYSQTLVTCHWLIQQTNTAKLKSISHSSVASFFSIGGGGASHPNVPTEEKKSQKHNIFRSQNTCYICIFAIPCCYLWYLAI